MKLSTSTRRLAGKRFAGLSRPSFVGQRVSYWVHPSNKAPRRFEVHFARRPLKKWCRICPAGYLEMSASFRSPSELGDLEG